MTSRVVPVASPMATEARRRVLFIDDEQHVLDGLRDALSSHRHDWQMTFLTGGETAFGLLDTQPQESLSATYDCSPSTERSYSLTSATGIQPPFGSRSPATRTCSEPPAPPGAHTTPSPSPTTSPNSPRSSSATSRASSEPRARRRQRVSDTPSKGATGEHNQRQPPRSPSTRSNAHPGLGTPTAAALAAPRRLFSIQ